MELHLRTAQAASPVPSGDEELIVSNLGLARLVVRRCLARLGPIAEADDLMQEACIGLIRAARHFDAGRGVRFSTYAFRCCWRACMDAVRSPGQPRTRRFPTGQPEPAATKRRIHGGGLLQDLRAAGASPDEQAAATEVWSRAMALKPLERAVLRQRFEQRQTYAAMARRHHCSRERITQIERAALDKVRGAK